MNRSLRTTLLVMLGLLFFGGHAWSMNCILGQAVSSGCTCPAPLVVVNGRCLGPGAESGSRGLQSCPPNMKRVGGHCQLVRRDCKPGQSTTGFLCNCKPPLKVIGGVCKAVPDCTPGQRVSSPCNCKSPLEVNNGVCRIVATAAPPKCKIGQRVRNCRCPAPYRVVSGKCACPGSGPCFQP